MDIPGYSIREAIGRGGMATAYLAVQESLGREVVLKVLDTRSVQNSDLVERFLAEGRIVAALNHPNIITIYDIGIAGDDLYISMEYVQGGDLKQRIKQGLSADTALAYLEQLARGLRAAHAHDIIHRDIKPANILFRADGTPLITDFGIAKQTTLDSELTTTGMFLGSPNYVSPEQADGYPVDGRTDIYSLGCVLFEMLTGSKPYTFSSVIDIVIQHKQAPVPTLPEELADFQPLVNGMMAKPVDARFADCDALLESIQALRDRRQARINATVQAPADKHAPGARRRVIQVLGVLLFLAAAFFATVLYVNARLNEPPDQTIAATTRSVLEQAPGSNNADEPNRTVVAGADDAGPNREEVMRALAWLGRQSLEEFKLTYPPRDNAYYYFNKLLEIDPDNAQAQRGISNIADRYAILAEQTLARGETEKTRTYIELGLKIEPDNRTLQSLQSLLKQESEAGFLDAIRDLFGLS
ncbi:serine/threonine protein kinase [Methylohalomonas lacus]|uniref:Serine/threonine protein kinase n=1 Tax=Methylohalomonas lacus TaxID=398773 RepID=A0AAE3L232_9GAMM|nr:serine/threonine-protein kinase [Methylohalomonas lacus]MCS3904435.1 serine/threonine protein kinase [Methylohalomonas lacus]